MNDKLLQILQLVKQSAQLGEEEKKAIVKAVTETDRQLSATEFELARVEQVNQTTSIQFAETMRKLEQKRKTVEAQNRQLEIEAALERVRARTMAMQKSEELPEVSSELYHQLKELGEPADQLTIGVVKEDENIMEMSATLQGKTLSQQYRHSIDEPIVMKKLFNAWKAGQRSLIIDIQGNELEQYNRYRNELTASTMFPVHITDERRILHIAFFPKGTLALATNQPRPQESLQLLERFAKVFEQTYTRFLDLQKAEAHARESQIQLALERVRARTMAMQHSNELSETIAILFRQMNELGNTPERLNIGIIKEDKGWVETWTTEQGGHKINRSFNARLDEPTTVAKLYEGWKARRTSMIVDISGNELKQWIRFSQDELKMPVKEELLQNRRVQSVAYFKEGFILITTPEPLPPEAISLLERFAEVFNLTYTRFLDLQKAEAQAREAKIEAALERVRSKTMAMHKSGDLLGIIPMLAEQFQLLGFTIHSVNVNTDYHDKDWHLWIYNPGAPLYSDQLHIPYFDHPFFNRTIESLENGSDFNAFVFTREEKDRFLDHIYSNTIAKNIPEERKKINYDAPGFAWSVVYLKNTALTIANYNAEPYKEEQNAILRKFGKVFEQSYVRFLDLQKAEAQAREAQIEAALERVRSRSLAMHKSDELTVIARIMFEQLRNLGLELEDGLIIMLFREDSNDQLQWPVLEGLEMDTMFVVPWFDHPVMNEVYKAKETGVKFIERHFGKAIKDDFLEKIFSITDYKVVPVEFQKKNFAGSCYHYSFAMEKFTGILMHSYSRESYPAEYNDIIKRFARVFEQAYIRFLDLQNAEAQAREAHIEASLERVRSKTMAMHSSDDVSVATATMFTELERLGIENFPGGITNLLPNRTQEVWSVNNLGEGKVVKAVGTFDIDAHPFWRIVFKEWEAKKDFLHYFLAGDEKEEYIKILNTTQGYLASAIEKFPDVHFQVYYFNEGAVFTNSLQPHSDEDKQIMKRFASVFALTFRRYQDLQKAEAQAREATIEAALERVRAKAMAMQNSNDLSIAASMVFTELRRLGISPIRAGVGLLNNESLKAPLYAAAASPEGDSLSMVGWVMLSGHPVLEKIYAAWLAEEDYFPVLSGEQLKSYYECLLSGLSVKIPDWQQGQKQYGHFFSFPVGCLYAWSEVAYNDAQIRILKRFATIIDLTFRRYMELQQSEANAKEAVKQAALDRIRADIASMRKVEDLDRITPLIWNELNILGIPFIRCGVFIMDDVQELIHTFLSAPDGKAIAAFHMPYDTPGNLGMVLRHWQEKRNYIDHWSENEFMSLADVLVKQGAISTREEYLSSLPQGGFHLHFLPFLQGMLYVGNTSRLNEEEIKLLQSVADAFSTAYARYEDFNKLEAAKKQVDSTLNELKATQKQLIQSEKMASLGELTAGIAHEIQNPLNFVNNFSEVNNELMEELQGEWSKVKGERNTAVEEEILNVIKQNTEKIIHHGKRADTIVKGMLQHSQKGTGQKEPTDINKLADEYLRLAYHGLRAKDKNFNADFKTDFDVNIGKINIVPQDMGRVLLNLFNNAFYTVGEQKKKSDGSYEPTVFVSTKRFAHTIEVIVKDNGAGIPKNIIEKIYQPFFTTKPTGQGTGLGLSLAYDIIKAHSGKIKVETNEGEGSEFIIQLAV